MAEGVPLIQAEEAIAEGVHPSAKGCTDTLRCPIVTVNSNVSPGKAGGILVNHGPLKAAENLSPPTQLFTFRVEVAQAPARAERHRPVISARGVAGTPP